MRFVSRLAVVISIAVIVACGEESRHLSVVLIGVDTLRPDHLGCYGYQRDTSPNIDRLAAEGVRAEIAISQAPWTLPSFATVFTSLYPTQHGATTVDSRVRPSVPTLAEILSEKGYATGAVVNAPLLASRYGLDRGFDFYDTTPIVTGRPADEVTRDALDWIDENLDRPFFLFVHYFDPHLSYAPPAPYDRMFDPEYTGPIAGSFNLDYFSSDNPSAIREEIETLSSADRNHIVSLYDGEIAFTDSAIGVLLEGLRSYGLEERTLIVLLSDHGEEFFDHGGLDHGHTLFDELIRVPLVLRLPGHLAKNTTLSRQVRLLDTAPTILGILSMEIPDHFEGVSLGPLLGTGEAVRSDGAALLPPDSCYSEALRHNETLKSMTSYPWKLVYDIKTEESLLFNLDQDPGEQVDAGPSSPRRSDELRRSIFKAVFGSSDTWYVQMAGGPETHIFDIGIKVGKDPARGNIRLPKLWRADGNAVDEAGLMTTGAGGSLIRVEDLSVSDTMTLAFKADPARMPLEFNLKIDGRPADSRTFLGRSLARPDTMPFIQRAGGRVVVTDKASLPRPDAPYCLVWYARSRFSGRTTFKLDDAAKRELRGLGYIQ